ncbi:hypothetical protein IFO70_26745 [Phormidium tenue FACHB-886]|nr:hypothetical protein [Phormidium tenue FACHB-886]
MINTKHQCCTIFTGAGQLLLPVIVMTGVLQTQLNPAIAQTEFCPDPGPIPASEATRSLELPQFALKFTIPENFRAILRHSGAVEILNPGTYQVLRCVAQGGQALGRGYTSTIVRSLPNPSNMNLRQFVEQNTRLNGSITPYVWHDKQGYLVRSRMDRSAQFWISPEMASEVVVISSGCDCDGMFNQLLILLENSSFLE